jgi:hypothetical protein
MINVLFAIGISVDTPGETPIARGSRSKSCPSNSAIFDGLPSLIETTVVRPGIEALKRRFL